jgi:rfaE bifunctional protein nucleotidyltransferase chain/domain
VQELQARGRQVVFTNGCFDLLHPGHVAYLEEARALGDALIVGVNTDASVARLSKGPGRPFTPEADRARVLAALTCVDRVVLFSEDTPLALITLLAPDVLVKGGDYRLDEIVGRDVVEARGGRVVALPFVPGYSTTGLIDRIRSGA